MKKLFYSGAGVAAVFLLLVGLNFLAGRTPLRLDLTEEKAFTLSAGTRSILSRLDTPVQVRLYVTQDAGMPPQLRQYARQVEDLLEEYRQASHGKLIIRKLDPQPDSEAEDSARLDGVVPQMLSNGEAVYLGLSVSLLDRKEAIPLLSPERERLLEYDLSRAISRVLHDEKPVIGVMSAFPLAGQQGIPMMGMRGEPAWVFYRELQRDFTLREVPLDADSIDPEIRVMLLVHPAGLEEKTAFALDQFVLGGGKLVAFLDPFSVVAQGRQQQPGMMPSGGGETASDLAPLLKAWGLSFEEGEAVVDPEYTARTVRGNPAGILDLHAAALSSEDILTADTGNLFMVYAGAFQGEPVKGLRSHPLVTTSGEASLKNAMMLQTASREERFAPGAATCSLGLRLSGRFPTAFPDGKPGADQTAAGEKKDGKPADSEPAKTADNTGKPAAPLKEGESTVILIGDADMLYDPIAVTEQTNPFTGGRVLLPANGNLSLVQAAIEQLAGDENLISVRSRASRERPFTVVQRMEEEATEAYRSQIAELEGSLAETQSRLAALERGKEGEEGQRFILSPEQQQELENFRKKEVEVRRKLKEVRRNLRAESDALRNRFLWLNMALMPVGVTLAGLILAVHRRTRRHRNSRS